MLTKWIWSPETEATKILHEAQQIACGFMQKNGLSMLDFPDLNWQSIPHFWKRVAKITDRDFPIFDKELVTQTVELLSKNNLILQPNTSEIEKLWAKNESRVINTIKKLIPKAQIKEIIIHPTKYCQFTMFSQENIEFYLPENLGVYEIVWTIVTCLTRKDLYHNFDANWSESQVLTDWIMARTPLSKYTQNGPSAIKESRQKQNGKLKLLNDKYLKKLGVPTSAVSLDLAKLYLNFNYREKQIMEKLMEAKGNIVSFDSIAEIICPNEDTYSLYAISKAIQRLRSKLPSENLIRTVRRQGYLLS